MVNKIVYIVYFLARVLDRLLRRKDQERAKKRELAIEILKNKESTKTDKLRALSDLAK